MLEAYVKHRLGRRRWFVHNRGEAGPLRNQQNLSFLQQRFLIMASDEYGQDKSDLPPEARRHL